MDHAPAALLVEQPGAHPRGLEHAHAFEIHAAGHQRVERRDRIVFAPHAREPDRSTPQARGQRRVERRSSCLAHARAPVRVDDVVHEEIARDHEIETQRLGSRFANALASAFTRSGSSGLDQQPSRFTADPTMKPSAAG